MRKSLPILLLGLFFGLSIPASTQAMPHFAGDETITPQESLDDDTYAAGGTLIFENTINGDLVLAGGNITVKGTVNGDLIVAGGNVDIQGTITDDVRVAGGNIKIDGAQIGDDLLAAGGTIRVDKNTRIAGSSFVSGGVADFAGTVSEDMELNGGEITFNGNVTGNAKIAADERFTLGTSAAIMGNLQYSADREPAFGTDFVRGNFEYKPHDAAWQAQRQTAWIWLILNWFLFTFASTFIVGLMLVWFFPYKLIRTTRRLYQEPAASLGKGFLTIVSLIALTIVSFITVVGIYLGLVFLFIFIVLLLVTGAFNGFSTAFWLHRDGKKDPSTLKMIGLLALGTAAYSLVTMIPVFGWIAGTIFGMMNIGAIYATYRETYLKLRKSKEI